MKQNISVTVDAVIFKDLDSEPKILLVERKNNPFKNGWALPGGFLEEGESLKDGAKRELQEETGVMVANIKQLKAYGAVNRDPRGRTISIAFVGAINSGVEVKAGDDAKSARWFCIDDLPALAFDHSEIINDARIYLQENNLSKA